MRKHVSTVLTILSWLAVSLSPQNPVFCRIDSKYAAVEYSLLTCSSQTGPSRPCWQGANPDAPRFQSGTLLFAGASQFDSDVKSPCTDVFLTQSADVLSGSQPAGAIPRPSAAPSSRLDGQEEPDARSLALSVAHALIQHHTCIRTTILLM
jgi:hypothetical protein